MVIAVTYKDGHVYEHLGKAPQMKLYTITEDNMITQETVDMDGSGHTKLVEFLKYKKANVLICGDIGAEAFKAIEAEGIEVYAGYSDVADVCVVAYLNNNLFKSLGPTCSKDGEEGCSCQGDCGECGEGGGC